MNLERIRTWFAKADPLLVDSLIAVGLMAAAFLQLWVFTHLQPAEGRIIHRFGKPPTRDTVAIFLPYARSMWFAYVAAAGSFLPLVLRRRIPWLAFALSSAFALIYTINPMPPTFTMLGPMIALYSLASQARRRHAGLVALGVVGLVLAMSAFTFSRERWVVELVGTFALLATAAFLGDTARSRREYIQQVEARATEAEQTREDEASRRVDEERIRVAREVHDIVAHSLSIVTVQAAAADALIDKDPVRAHESIGHIRVTSKQALTELRSVIGVLRTGDVDAPLEPTADLSRLDALVEQVRGAGLAVDVTIEADLDRVPTLASVSAYRIVQEALTNVVRHARATSVQLHLAEHGDTLLMDITDDGTAASAKNGIVFGHGLRGMFERVEALGGTFEAGPRSNEPGFAVRATIPMTRAI